MPNSRRRKFSARKGIKRTQRSTQNDVEIGNTNINLLASNTVTLQSSPKTMKNSSTTFEDDFGSNSLYYNKTKDYPDTLLNKSRGTNKVFLISDCDSSTSNVTVKKRSIAFINRDVTASSSNIDMVSMIYDPYQSAVPWTDYNKIEVYPKRITRDKMSDRFTYRQHRMKVRSPRRRAGILDCQSKTIDTDKLKVSVGTIAFDEEICVSSVNLVSDVEDEQHSDHSDDMCRICHGGHGLSREYGQLVSACSCRGTVGRVHVKCLERWLTESGKSKCELCGTRYITRRVHRYGVPKAIVMWILSQNAKQLLVDCLGIVLMSPLAMLAAWLSGRTLAGLVMQEARAPWPLASTFVLACMTLVCYYCWIVSAATRHAIGWWVWYRSQYEVRLQLIEDDD